MYRVEVALDRLRPYRHDGTVELAAQSGDAAFYVIEGYADAR
jgi:hypothetical protein